MTIVPNRKLGRIKIFDQRGFGFVHADDGSETFFHISNWPQGADEPAQGMRIAFVAGINPRNQRPWAEQITVHGLEGK